MFRIAILVFALVGVMLLGNGAVLTLLAAGTGAQDILGKLLLLALVLLLVVLVVLCKSGRR